MVCALVPLQVILFVRIFLFNLLTGLVLYILFMHIHWLIFVSELLALFVARGAVYSRPLVHPQGCPYPPSVVINCLCNERLFGFLI